MTVSLFIQLSNLRPAGDHPFCSSLKTKPAMFIMQFFKSIPAIIYHAVLQTKPVDG
jgi:hypothetical protein